MRTQDELQGVTLLGQGKTKYPTDYAPEVLEKFGNRYPGRDYFVRFHCPEMTCLCPMTGQPDYATILINYIPDQYLVESKSLKLYLFSYRNHGDFHEDTCNDILRDLVNLLDPKYMEVIGLFYPRGGISIHPVVTYARPGSGYEQYAKDRLFTALPNEKAPSHG